VPEPAFTKCQTSIPDTLFCVAKPRFSRQEERAREGGKAGPADSDRQAH
jgi:hypothetical protein